MLRLPGRNEDYLRIAMHFTEDVVKDGTTLAFFPRFLRPWAYLTRFPLWH